MSYALLQACWSCSEYRFWSFCKEEKRKVHLPRARNKMLEVVAHDQHPCVASQLNRNIKLLKKSNLSLKIMTKTCSLGRMPTEVTESATEWRLQGPRGRLRHLRRSAGAVVALGAKLRAQNAQEQCLWRDKTKISSKCLKNENRYIWLHNPYYGPDMDFKTHLDL